MKKTGWIIFFVVILFLAALGSCSGDDYDAYDLREAQGRYYSGEYTREDEIMVEGFNKWKAEQDKYID